MAPAMAAGLRKPQQALSLAASSLVLLLFAASAAGAGALVFHVGGPRGWRVPDANTSYGWWAMNNRFHVGDGLYFKFENDSVLVVDRAAFDVCNTTEPIARFADGATTVRLDRPGFFCFISGEPGHCEEGQKLVVRVMVHPAVQAAAVSPGPAYAPATSQPGRGGGGGSSGSGARAGPTGRPHRPGASSGAAAVAPGAALALAMAALAGLVLRVQ
ncbi:hypothetical protein GUJ93_ZPchr0001g31081 [Zizania palustris]|uniref:Phytocyanin domain-containing protein n=1 Tax=Zizania palustris TaxID=103762 RepID=A0A8J5RFF6_ZIZPA|nr:hypothetical protein GUJ93_ZPchr0001g31081 [Zizania palustris]